MTKKYIPVLFIDIGETNAFYTLRETYEHKIYIRGEGVLGGSIHHGVYQGTIEVEIRSFHHYNLSQNADEAYAKALAASESLGLRLITKREGLDIQMRDIKRATAEELAERQRKWEARQAEWAAEQEAKMQEHRDNLKKGILSFTTHGKYEPIKLEALPVGFINWCVGKKDEFEEGSLMKDLAVALLERVPHMILPVPSKTATVGEYKQRLKFDVTVIRTAFYDINSFSGYGTDRVYITTMVTKEGVCLVCKSGSFSAEVGEKFNMMATVVAFDEYQDQMQTIVQRVKIMEQEQ